MKKLLLLLPLSIIICQLSIAQNLVPNPSFENFTTCPVGFSQFNGYVSDWVNPSTASPDYYNACANPNPAGVPANGTGYQQSHSGDAYAGGYMTAGTYREFIQVQLTSPLVAGVAYQFEMYVVLHNKSEWATDDLGAYFSVTAPTSTGTGFLNGNPLPQITNAIGNVITDTLNWTLISGSYVAGGGEMFVTLGHFQPDAITTYTQVNFGSQGSYYYFDDISLTGNAVLPVADFTASTTEICAGTCINYNNLSQNATSYEWTFPGGSPSVDTAFSPATVCYEVPGTYAVTLIASNSTTSDTATFTSYITVNPLPSAPTIIQSGDTISVPQNFSSYQWYHDSVSIAGATDYFYVVPESGNYNIIVTDNNGCSVGAGILNVISEVFQFNVQSSMLQLFPNPSHDVFIVSIPEIDSGVLDIFNPIGEIVFSKQLTTKYSILNTNLPAGIYFVRVISERNIYSTKVVVE